MLARLSTGTAAQSQNVKTSSRVQKEAWPQSHTSVLTCISTAHLGQGGALSLLRRRQMVNGRFNSHFTASQLNGWGEWHEDKNGSE